MIIFGTRGVTYQVANGNFACPSCGPDTQYAHKRVRRFFTLYFIPVIPLDTLGEYVECGGCANTYKPEVLSFDPTAGRKAFEAEFHTVIRRVMILMMLADGEVADAEVASIAQICEKMTGKPIAPDAIRAEAAEMQKGAPKLEAYVAQVRGQLNDKGKELVVKAALAVASADGTLADDERMMLLRIGEALEMTEAHLMGVMAAAAAA